MVVEKQRGINGQKEYFAIDCSISEAGHFLAPLTDINLEPEEERRVQLNLEVSTGFGATAIEAIVQCENNRKNY